MNKVFFSSDVLAGGEEVEAEGRTRRGMRRRIGAPRKEERRTKSIRTRRRRRSSSQGPSQKLRRR